MVEGQKKTVSTEGHRRHYLARVVDRRELRSEFLWLELDVEGLGGARPGQFVVVHCADQSEQRAGKGWGESAGWPEAESPEMRTRKALMRRPFSIADMPAATSSDRICLQFRVLGPGTVWLAENARPGATLRLVGPLGNGFNLDGVRKALLAAGGMGVAPMLFLARTLVGQGSEVVLLTGAKSREQLPLQMDEGAQIDEEGEPCFCCRDFSELDVRVGIATDDGSVGRFGLLSDTVADYLSRHWEFGQTGTMVYTCGPEPMMAKVSQAALKRQLPVQVCLERYMACGLGACQSCVCRQKSEQAQDSWTYRLVCTDGPVFDGRSILW